MVACADSEEGGDSEPWKIGALYDLSQTYAFIGKPTLAGLRTAIDATNRAGGVHGRQIELIVRDDRSDPANARTSFRELVDAGVVAVSGPNASATLVPLAPVITQSQVPDISLAAVADLHRPGQPYLFATGLHVADSALIDANWMADEAAKRGITNPRVAALSLDTPSVAEFREMLVTAVPEVTKGELVANDVVAVDATDMNNAMLPIANLNPDFVPVGLLGSQLPGAVRSLRNRGVNAPVMNYFVASDQATFEAVDDPEFYAVRHFAEPNETDVPGLEKMRQDAEAAGQVADMTSGYFTHGYVSGLILVEALRNCGPDCDGPAMNQALEGITNLDTNGLSGPIGVSSEDHLFVKYGRMFGWDPATRTVVPKGDWIGGRATS